MGILKTRKFHNSIQSSVSNLFVSILLCAAIACSSNERPSSLNDLVDPYGPLFVDAFSPPFQIQPQPTNVELNCATDVNLCACKEVGQKPPTLFIVLDRSSSMNETIQPSGYSKWDLVRFALLDSTSGVLRTLDGRLSTGVAVFPGENITNDTCSTGTMVFEPRPGSETTYNELAQKLSSILPQGSTPIAASLRALKPILEKQEKTPFVLLATDGAPNCNTIPCSSDHCIYNLEQAKLTNGQLCDETINCCDPNLVQGGGWQACVDDENTIAAINDLTAIGIKVFVLGIPGSSTYSTILDRFAVAGQTARMVTPHYYAANELTQNALQNALREIAAEVIDSCIVTLDAPVDDGGFTNVLIDGKVLVFESNNGWRWLNKQTLELTGSVCNRIKAHQVSRIQVAVGCRTIVR